MRLLYDPGRPDDVNVEFASKKRFYATPLALLGAGSVSLLFLLSLVARDGRYFSCVACGTGVTRRHAFCYSCGAKIPSRKGRMIK